MGERRTLNSDNRKAHYLAEARKAEELAARAVNPEVRDSWLKVAEGYRKLAQDSGKP
jgi:hypothetical protein